MIFDTDDIQTLGDLKAILAVLKIEGWSPESVQYVVERVWWEEWWQK